MKIRETKKWAMSAKNILIVEDNLADAYLIQRAAEECGRDLHAWVVHDGPEALGFLRKDHPLTHVPTPLLIILDLRLPTLDGTDLLPLVRQLPAYRATPIVILSSAPKEREEPRCLQLGANAFVQKAQNFYVYFAAIQSLVRDWLPSANA
jgi:CheY-like chemotaxis protein